MRQCKVTNERPGPGTTAEPQALLHSGHQPGLCSRTKCSLCHPDQVGDVFTLPDWSKMVLGCTESGFKASVYHHTQSNHLPVWRKLCRYKCAMSLYKKRSKLYWHKNANITTSNQCFGHIKLFCLKKNCTAKQNGYPSWKKIHKAQD